MPEASANGNYASYLGQPFVPPFAGTGTPQMGSTPMFGSTFGGVGANSLHGAQPQYGQSAYGFGQQFAQPFGQQFGQTSFAGGGAQGGVGLGGAGLGGIGQQGGIGQIAPTLATVANYIGQQIPVIQHIAQVLSQVAQHASYAQHGFGQAVNPLAHYAMGQQGLGGGSHAGAQQLAWTLGQLATQLAQQQAYGQATTQQVAWTLGQVANQLAQQSRFGQGQFGVNQAQGGYWGMPHSQPWGAMHPAMY